MLLIIQSWAWDCTVEKAEKRRTKTGGLDGVVVSGTATALGLDGKPEPECRPRPYTLSLSLTEYRQLEAGT